MKQSANLILFGIIAGILLGGIFGTLFPEPMASIGWIGDLFLRMLKLLVVPLVITSMISGIAGLGDVRHLGKTGSRTVAYYMATTLLSVLLGLVLVNIVRPGDGFRRGGVVQDAIDLFAADSTLTAGIGELESDRALLVVVDRAAERDAADPRLQQAFELLRPERVRGLEVAVARGARAPAEAVRQLVQLGDEATRQTLAKAKLDTKHPMIADQLAAGELTPMEAVSRALDADKKTPGEAMIALLEGMFPSNIIQAAANTDVLPIVIFSLIFGAVLTTLGATGEPVLAFFRGANEAIMKIVHLVMWLAPVGIFGLIAGRVGSEGGGGAVWHLITSLGAYTGTVILGLALHAFVVLPLALWLFTKRSPLFYLGAMSRALLTAFSTASSSATLPITIECAETKGGVSERSSQFVLPLGATINMDGTALYEAVAVMFIAQAYGIDLGVLEQVIIFLTATLAAIGAAGIPEAGLVTMVMVLSAVNLPLSGMALILAIDWFLDRCRTTVNVWGDSIGAAVIDHFEKRDEAAVP